MLVRRAASPPFGAQSGATSTGLVHGPKEEASGDARKKQTWVLANAQCAVPASGDDARLFRRPSQVDKRKVLSTLRCSSRLQKRIILVMCGRMHTYVGRKHIFAARKTGNGHL